MPRDWSSPCRPGFARAEEEDESTGRGVKVPHAGEEDKSGGREFTRGEGEPSASVHAEEEEESVAVCN